MDGVSGQATAKLVCPACNARYEGGQFCAKDGTPLVKDQNAAGKADMVGQVLADRYRIIKLIGEGGMGQVYEAQHVNINKRFAIKLLRPEIVANPEAVARFRQEAWSASSIGHENIIEIDDFATLPNGSVYLAMEYLQGMALAERMKAGPALEVGEALDIFCQVARGLASAHEKGIVHRDMKPENIFLATKGHHTLVKILDFGIAKVSGAEGQASLTRTGAIFGTPHYMSPEQALGKQLDHRSDIYSVGVIMYEVFTGKVPFEAESFMGILTKHITAEPRRPSEAAPDRMIAPEIEEIIMRAMCKESSDRYSSMADMMADVIEVMKIYAADFLSPSGQTPLVLSRPKSGQVAVSGTGAQRVLRQSQPPGQPIAATMLPADALRKNQPTPTGQRHPIAATMVAGSGQLPVAGAGSRPMPVAQREPSGAFRRGTGPQPTPSQSTGPQPVAGGHSGVMPATDAVNQIPFAYPDGAPKKKGGAGIIIAVAVVLALGGGAAAYVLLKPPPPAPQPQPQPPITVKDPVVATKDPVVATKDPVPTPAQPEAVAMIVDTTPSGAKIYKDGAVIGETPDTVKVPNGQTVQIMLKKDGFFDEPITIDPSKGRKSLTKLSKLHGGVKKNAKHAPAVPIYSSPAAVKLPSPPPLPPTASPTPTPPVKPAALPPAPAPPTHKKKPVADPYERLDDAPTKKDVLDPYK